MKLAIIAGGMGTRLGFKNLPKPMIKIGGKPLLEHQICLAKQYGINDIYILSGHQADVIEKYFGDGRKWDVHITYFIEKQPLGTAGAVKQLENRVRERFLVFYGDVVFNVDLASFMEFDKQSDSVATIVVHPNDHPYDSDLVEINDRNIVTAIHPKPHKKNVFYRNLVNAAIYILGPEIFEYIPKNKPSDFGKDIFPLLLKEGKVLAYKTAEYIKDIGIIERFRKVNRDFNAGKVKRFSKRHKKPAIFIDRDGTLIKDVHLLCRLEDLEIYPFSSSAIKKINNSDFLCFLITNQPVVARNLCDVSKVNEIHNKLETLLGEKESYLNDIYFCPHHSDKGYPEENASFKIDCDCRKPKIGMIKKAAKEYNVDIESSWLIGDTTRDIQTGLNAGLKTILVRTGKGGKDGKFQCIPDFVFDDLASAVDFILKDRLRYEFYIKEIINHILRDDNHFPFLVCIGGLARSGKTTFIKLLSETLLGNAISYQVLSLDNWLAGIDEREDHMTVRERYRYDEITEDIKKIINNEKISLKIYDPYSRKISNETEFSLNGERCLIIDGVPSLDIPGLRNLSRMRVYIEIDEHVRKKRFFNFYRWKDLPDEEIEYLYSKRLSDEMPYIEDSKKNAHIIVRI